MVTASTQARGWLENKLLRLKLYKLVTFAAEGLITYLHNLKVSLTPQSEQSTGKRKSERF